MSETLNNGGPAFPVVYPDWVGHEGMSLRDYLAAKMLGAAYHSFWTLQSGQVPDNWRDGLAQECYKMADTMLRVREQK